MLTPERLTGTGGCGGRCPCTSAPGRRGGRGGDITAHLIVHALDNPLTGRRHAAHEPASAGALAAAPQARVHEAPADAAPAARLTWAVALSSPRTGRPAASGSPLPWRGRF